jgi:hypothetical protein
LTIPTPLTAFTPENKALLAFLQDVRAIEEWAAIEFDLPATMTGEEARDVAIVADTVVRGGRELTWHDMTLRVESDGVAQLEAGVHVIIEETLSAGLLGRNVELGRGNVAIRDYTVSSVTPLTAEPGAVDVLIAPPSGGTADLFETLTKPAAPVWRSPPRKAQRDRTKRAKKKR